MNPLLNKKFLFMIITFILSGSVLVFRANAAASQVNVCNPPAQYYGGIRDFFFKDIRETTMNHLTSATTDFAFNVATGTEMKSWMGCTYYIEQKIGSCSNAYEKAMGCEETPEEVCADIYNQFRATGSTSESATTLDYTQNKEKFASGYIAGSMLGVAHTLENTLVNEPIPVNYAFYFKDYASRTPILSEAAFAQVDYAQPLVNEILGLWKLIRNIAYAAMAVIIMVIGIMIITRRKISQQVVVNVQYALPKLVLTMILITFSYPIGAAIASLGWALYNSADLIVSNMAAGAGLDCGVQSVAVGSGVAALITGIILALFTTGIGFFIGVFVIILILVIVGMYLAVMVKAFFIYVKMLIYTIASPIMFVYGAIPGNDSQVWNWFKKMGAYAVSLFFMGLAVQFVFMLAMELVANQGGSVSFSGMLYVVLLSPLLALLGLGFAFKIPNMVEDTLMGTKRR